MSLAIHPPTRSGQRVGPTVRPGRPAGALLFGLVGLAADALGGGWPLLFAALLILGIGLPHGASDHLVATGGQRLREAPGRLVLFLLLYLGALVATLLLWRAAPGPTLAAFLLLSAIHFAIDDVTGGWRLAERAARGLMPVTLPALLHPDMLAGLFAALSTPAAGAWLAGLASTLAPPVLLLAVLAAILRLRRGERGPAAEIALCAAALALFSPLVGFALVFALVHSRGQTRERIRALRLSGLRAYLRACWPTLLGAAILFAALGLLLASGRAPALGPLFIGLAALTVPHMLVTPLFERAA